MTHVRAGGIHSRSVWHHGGHRHGLRVGEQVYHLDVVSAVVRSVRSLCGHPGNGLEGEDVGRIHEQGSSVGRVGDKRHVLQLHLCLHGWVGDTGGGRHRHVTRDVGGSGDSVHLEQCQLLCWVQASSGGTGGGGGGGEVRLSTLCGHHRPFPDTL